MPVDLKGHKDDLSEVHVPVSQAEVAPLARFPWEHSADPQGQHAWSLLHRQEALDPGPDASLHSDASPAT